MIQPPEHTLIHPPDHTPEPTFYQFFWGGRGRLVSGLKAPNSLVSGLDVALLEGVGWGSKKSGKPEPFSVP